MRRQASAHARAEKRIAPAAWASALFAAEAVPWAGIEPGAAAVSAVVLAPDAAESGVAPAVAEPAAASAPAVAAASPVASVVAAGLSVAAGSAAAAELAGSAAAPDLHWDGLASPG